MFVPIAAKPNGAMCGERPVRTALFSDISADLELNCLFWKQNSAVSVQVPILAKNTKVFLLSNPHTSKHCTMTLLHTLSQTVNSVGSLWLVLKISAVTGVNFQIKCMKMASHQFYKCSAFGNWLIRVHRKHAWCYETVAVLLSADSSNSVIDKLYISGISWKFS